MTHDGVGDPWPDGPRQVVPHPVDNDELGTRNRVRCVDSALDRNQGVRVAMDDQCRVLDPLERISAMGNIERAMERTSAQVAPRDYKVSTANYPDQDIHDYFLRGDQRWFHTECDCPNGIVLSKVFPNCIDDLSTATPKRLRMVEAAFISAGRPYLGMNDRELEQFGQATYFCPKCHKIITDPRAGWWEADNPEAYGHSYQMPQLLSPTYPAARVLQKYNNANDIQEFWNSTVGIPWIDPETQPVRPEHLMACVNPKLRWYANMSDRWRKKHVGQCALGAEPEPRRSHLARNHRQAVNTRIFPRLPKHGVQHTSAFFRRLVRKCFGTS